MENQFYIYNIFSENNTFLHFLHVYKLKYELLKLIYNELLFCLLNYLRNCDFVYSIPINVKCKIIVIYN